MKPPFNRSKKNKHQPYVVEDHWKAALGQKVEPGELVDDGPVGTGLQLVIVEEVAWNLKKALVRSGERKFISYRWRL
jgi:hypothetical protein